MVEKKPYMSGLIPEGAKFDPFKKAQAAPSIVVSHQVDLFPNMTNASPPP